MDLLIATAVGAIVALAPLAAVMYAGKRLDYVRGSGALAAFATGFVLALLAQWFYIFYARFTYLLALSLLSVSLVYTWWGVYRRRWQMYFFAAAGWIYIIVLAAVARALGWHDPFPM